MVFDIDVRVPGINDPSELTPGERVRLRRAVEREAVRQLRKLGYSKKRAKKMAVSATAYWEYVEEDS